MHNREPSNVNTLTQLKNIDSASSVNADKRLKLISEAEIYTIQTSYSDIICGGTMSQKRIVEALSTYEAGAKILENYTFY